MTPALRYYFCVEVLYDTLFDNVPSVALRVSCYLYQFVLALNYPLFTKAAIQSRIEICLIPRYWNIARLSEGEMAWRAVYQIPLGPARYIEDLLCEARLK